MPSSSELLIDALHAVIGDKVLSLTHALGEATLIVAPADLLPVMQMLRDHSDLDFAMLADVCGVDYLQYAELPCAPGQRFAAVYHLLSLNHNRRLRVRTFAADDEFPVLASVVDLWPSANWFEREAFDLFGIMFEGHPDLRRILTDYGFIGHPFRK
ncbi:MAG: NADH-quinone oxidoreductase subunit C, partial [Betaproteobacteria bacterium]